MPNKTKPEKWPVQIQPTHGKCKGDETGDTCAADIKQIIIWLTKKAGKNSGETINGWMTCSKWAVNALGLSKQDNTNSTCAADVEQIIIWSANNTVIKVTEIMTCSKSTAN